MRFIISVLIAFCLTITAISQVPKIWGSTRNGGSTGSGIFYSMDVSGQNFLIKKEFITTVPGSSPRFVELTNYNGLLYGTARSLGKFGFGVLFSWDPVSNIYTDIYDFDESNGSFPLGNLTLYNNQLYGMTNSGGANGKGVLFEFNPDTRIFTKKIDLTDANGSNPQVGGLTLFNGIFYGMTFNGGTNLKGVLFSWNPVTNIFSKLVDFNSTNGATPYGNLTLFNNKLYGMTNTGGTNNMGVLFEYDPLTTVFTKKLDFNSTNGRSPYGSLTIFNNKLYGMTAQGGTNGFGTLFEYDAVTNTFSTKVALASATGWGPYGNLTLFNNRFYGLTYVGGQNGVGALFEWDPVTNIYTYRFGFGGEQGYNPQSSLTVFNNKLYGVSGGGKTSLGVLFEFDPLTATYTRKREFMEGSDGVLPYAKLTRYNNKYYGTTIFGGSNSLGTIYETDSDGNQFLVKVNLPQSNLAAVQYGLYPFNNKLYGCTAANGNINSNGGLFEFDPVANSFAKKIDFLQANGYSQIGRMVLLNNKFYGVMAAGGANNIGAIFEYDPASNVYTKKYDFVSTIGTPTFGMALYNNKFYGLTNNGGTNNQGALYEWDYQTNTVTKKIDFISASGSTPASELSLYNNKFYGLTTFGGVNNKGVIFEWDPTTNIYTKKVDFDGTNGAAPQQSWLELRNNLFYGTTVQGGNNNVGVVFSYNPATNTIQKIKDFDYTSGANPNMISIDPPAIPAITTFAPASGPVGTTVTITGNNFNTIPSDNIVFFGTIKAAVTAASATSLTVTVPVGANYKPVSVTTNNLTAYSAKPFTVTFPGVKENLTTNAFAFRSNIGFTSGLTFINNADIDGDGQVDLVATSDGTSAISIRRLTGTIVNVSVNVTTATNPVSFAVGDLDGDGKPDIAVACASSRNITILKNTSTVGSISFSTYNISGGTLPYGTTIADLDKDGKPELIVTDMTGNVVTVYKNNSIAGNIAFSDKIDIPVNANSASVAASDLDGDGKVDLLVAYYSGGISILRNIGTDNAIVFAPKIDLATGGSWGIAAGDIDGDGKTDLVAPNGNTNSVTVFKNASSPGTISFTSAATMPTGTGPFAVAIADLDGDNNPDIAVTNINANSVSVLRNLSTAGNFSFAPKTDLFTGNSPRSLSIVDYNKDGKPDITTANNGDNTVSLIRNKINETFISSFTPANGNTGTPLIIRGGYFSGATGVTIGGTAASSFVVDSSSQITAIIPGIVSGDVIVNTPYGSGSLSGFYNGPKIISVSPVKGTPGSTVAINGNNFSPSPAGNTVYFGSVKAQVQSGNANLLNVTVPAGASFQPLSVTHNGFIATADKPFSYKFSAPNNFTSNSFSAGPTYATNVGPVCVAGGDFNGDGKPDLVTTYYSTGASSISIYPNTTSGGTVSFGSKIDLVAGSMPEQVAVADLDGDGKLDIAVANINSNTVSVFRNISSNGTIAFAPKLDLVTGLNPEGIAIGDLNGDGRIDIAVTNSAGNTVSVFQNKSTPGSLLFNTKLDFITGTTPIGVAISDLNADGFPDLLIANYNASSISLLLNNKSTGAPSFSFKVDVTTGVKPWSIAATDLDGDDLPDVVTSNLSGSISLFRNISTASALSLTARTDFTTSAYSFSFSDYDGDGLTDIATVNSPGTISLFRNISTTGVLAMAPKVDITVSGASLIGIAAVDLNNDGKPDLTTVNQTTNTLYVQLNGSNGPTIISFSPKDGAPGSYINISGQNFTGATAVSIGGISATSYTIISDSLIQALVPDIGSGDVLVTTPQGTATLNGFYNGPVITSFTPASGFIGTNVTITGKNFSIIPNQNTVSFGSVKATIVSASATSLTATVPAGGIFKPVSVTRSNLTAYSEKPFLLSRATSGPDFTAGTFETRREFTSGANPVGVTATDINGDGKPDIGIANWGFGSGTTISHLLNQSTSQNLVFGAKADVVVGTGPWDIMHIDLDGDGKPDVITTNESDNTISISRNLSSGNTISFGTRINLTTGNTPESIAVGDIDLDGKPDIVVTNIYANTISVFRNITKNNILSFSSRIDLPTGLYPQSLVLADLDKDGKPEIITANKDGYSVSVFKNRSTVGAILFDSKVDFPAPNKPWSISVGDLDGDGMLDIITGNSGNATVSVLQNVGINTISLAAAIDFPTNGAPLSIALNDLNGDGKPDIIAGSSNGFLSLLNNKSVVGNVSFGTKVDFQLASGSYGVSTADLDVDGQQDIIVANNSLSSFSVFRNKISGPQTITFDSIPDKVFGDTAFYVHATASSGLPNLYKVLNGNARVTDSLVTITGTGTVTLQATQPGNDAYLPATANRTFQVIKATQAITFDSIPNQRCCTTAAIPLNARSSSGLPVSYSIISGYGYVSGNLFFRNGVGTVTVRAYQTGSQNFNPAFIDRTFCVYPIAPDTITGYKKTCPSTQSYSVTKIQGAHYHWSISEGGSFQTNDTNSVAVTWTGLGLHTLSVEVSGCDSVRQKPLVIEVTQPLTPAVITTMFPVNGTIVRNYPVSLYWKADPNALYYDVYIWPDSLSMPSTPVVFNSSRPNAYINSDQLIGLRSGQKYNWTVVAKNACLQTQGVVQSFFIPNLPNLVVKNVQAGSNLFSGTNAQISWVVKNTGKESTLSQSWYDYVYLSRDSILDLTLRPGLEFQDTYLGGKINQASLDTGTSYVSTLNVHIPDSISGSFYIIVVASLNKAIPEESYNDNQDLSSTNVTLSPYPDLQVTAVGTPEDGFSGKSVHVTYKVQNKGTGATRSPEWKDYIYLSADPQFDPATAIKIAENQHYQNASLITDDFYTADVSVRLPIGIFGKYYIYVNTDVFNQVYEYIFNGNNVGRNDSINIILSPPADFTVTNINTVDQISAGEKISVSYSVRNAGAGVPELINESQHWFDGLFISDKPYLDETAKSITATAPLTRIYECERTQNYVRYCADFPFMNSGETYSFSMEGTIPQLNTGSYYLYVVTDAGNNVYEYNKETNNARSKIIQVLSPDLQVGTVTAADTAWSGKNISVTWLIKNYGPGKLIDKSRIDRIILSTSATYNLSAVILSLDIRYTGALDPQASLFKQSDFRIPNGISGNYYLLIVTDYSNDIVEGNENNNISQAIPLYIKLSPWPDLHPEMLTILSDTITIGSKLNYSYRVYNRGIENMSGYNWKDVLYLSKYQTPSYYTDVQLQPNNIGEAVSINGFYEKNDSATLSYGIGLQAGEYYIHLVTDAYDNVYEYQFENNNRLVSRKIYLKEPPHPDLMVTRITALDSAFSGKPISVAWTVKNKGGITIYFSNSWNDKIFLSRDTILDNSDLQIDINAKNGTYATGEGYSISKSIVIPNGISGNYYVFVLSDSEDYLKDADRTNNANLVRNVDGSAKPLYITLTPWPDLLVRNVMLPETGIAGQPVHVKWSVKNNGIAATERSWQDKIYLSEDTIPAHGSELFTVSHHNLNVGEEYTDSADVVIPLNMLGSYQLIVFTDAVNVLYEYNNEANNLVANQILSIEQPPSDLIVSNISVPAQLLLGDSLTTQWDLSNIGVFPATGYQTSGIYLSNDSSWSSDDAFIGEVPSSINLAPGSGDSLIKSLRVTDVDPGNYFTIVKADILNNINETDKQNNAGVSATKVLVTVPELVLNNVTPVTLRPNGERYFRLEIPDSLVGETIQVRLTGSNAANELYAKFGTMAKRNSYDFAFASQGAASQEILIPAAQKGTYYILIYEQSGSSPQQASIIARKINFEIITINANRGGNTGLVTVKITGAKFEPGMRLSLLAGDSIPAYRISYVNNNTIYGTFNLAGRSVGTYTVKLVKQNNAATSLPNSFTIEVGAGGGVTGGGSGSGGSSGGFFCKLGNQGVDALLGIEFNIPKYMLVNKILPITINYGNTGNVDIPVPRGVFISDEGLPLALSQSDLANATSELPIVFKELNGPDDILRPGVTGSITFYVKVVSATQQLFGHQIIHFKLIQ